VTYITLLAQTQGNFLRKWEVSVHLGWERREVGVRIDGLNKRG